MSVKKSLWLSAGLVMALSLLFLGCPTEAESSSETVSYERTALWAAVVAAETDLNSAFVSERAGVDIAPAQKWVTQAQYDAFKGAIGEAQAVAYTLTRAVEATPAEEPAIAALTAARNTFDGQKDDGKATDVIPAGKWAGAALAAGDFEIVTGDVTLDDGGTAGLSIAAGGALTIAPGAKLTLKAAKLAGAIAGTIIVKEGGTLLIENIDKDSKYCTGELVLEKGATLIDKKDGGDSLLADSSDTGKYTIHAGATLIANSAAFGGPREAVIVGSSSGNYRGEFIQLNSGILTLKAEQALELDGNATLVYNLPVKSMALGATSILTVDGGSLLGVDNDDDFLNASTTGAKIVLRNAASNITVVGAAKYTTSDLPAIALTGIDWTFDNPVGSSGKAYIAGPVVLLVNIVSGSTVLVKQ
ncbi:MAG: hypothetical protein LBG08_05940 [Spirochaetaceae bacterium]|jgi:hypothetical protein|nr:hypothetical protein [Spirochaetaceae bacterium]